MINKKSGILILENDNHLLQMVQRILELGDYEVSTTASGEAALTMFNEVNPSLVLSDLMLPGMEGSEVYRYIRQFSKTPILIMTAKGTIDEKAKVLNLGQNDYITKPFSAQKLIARIAAPIQRSNSPKKPIPNMIIKCRGGLKIDLGKKLVTIDNAIIDLSSTEYRILAFLAMNSDRIVSSEEILNAVWGNMTQKDLHLLQVNIGRLRKKLKDDVKDKRYIETKHGTGYYMTCREVKR